MCVYSLCISVTIERRSYALYVYESVNNLAILLYIDLIVTLFRVN